MPDEFRTRGKGDDRTVYPLNKRNEHVRASSPDEDKWIQQAINPGHKGQSREYIYKLYGPEAFTERGTIKEDYLDRGIEHARSEGDLHHLHQLEAAKRLHGISRERRGKPHHESEAAREAARKNIRKADKAWEEMTEEEREKARAHEEYRFNGTMHNGEVTELTIKREEHS